MSDEPLTIYKSSFVVPWTRELWDDGLAIRLDLGITELLPGVTFENAWDLWAAGQQVERDLFPRQPVVLEQPE